MGLPQGGSPSPRHCERSEAIHKASREASGLPRRLRLLAMTGRAGDGLLRAEALDNLQPKPESGPLGSLWKISCSS